MEKYQMEVNNEIMEIVSFEKRTFEEMAAKLDYFVQRMDDLCRQHGRRRQNDGWTAMPSARETAYQPEDIADPP